MSESTKCRICHRETPPDGRSVCDRCMGFDRTKPKSPGPNVEPPTETTLHTCETCGAPIKPYKIGKVTRTTGECRNCYCLRRYGPNWKPGGQTKEEKAAKIKEWREKKKANGGNGGSETLQPGTSEPNMDKCNMVRQANNLPEMPPQKQPKATAEALSTLNIKHVTLVFVDDDEAMFERLKNIATKKRRSMEQQVLYFLDRVIEI